MMTTPPHLRWEFTTLMGTRRHLKEEKLGSAFVKIHKMCFEGKLTTIRPPTPTYQILGHRGFGNIRRISGIRHQFGKFPVKFQLNSSGLKVPVDYCNTTGFLNLLKFYGILQMDCGLENEFRKSEESPFHQYSIFLIRTTEITIILRVLYRFWTVRPSS